MSGARQKILILNGPNLNMLGQREPEIYGTLTLTDIKDLCEKTAAPLHITTDFRQSNHEGELVGWIQDSLGTIDGLIINAAAYTHTSIAIHDALRLLNVPIIEVHLSDPKKREDFRKFSYIESLSVAVFAGFREKSYVMAIEKMAEILGQKKAP